MNRDQMVDQIASSVVAKSLPHPVRVGIDGPDGAGKSILADEVATRIRALGGSVIRASVDGFHRPSSERLARYGRSPEGYYRDSFDYPALRRVLLDRLGPAGDLSYRTAVFDFRNDVAVADDWQHADPGAILLFDGVFLLRPELQDAWDLSIYLHVGWDEVLRRVVQRDSSWMGAEDEVRERYLSRYIPGQQLYLEEAAPRDVADVVIDNSDFEAPFIL